MLFHFSFFLEMGPLWNLRAAHPCHSGDLVPPPGVNFFSKNKLNLNIDKSCFLIINPKKEDRRTSIILNSGVLKYKSKFDYLDVIVSDYGLLKEDVKSFIVPKNGNVTTEILVTNESLCCEESPLCPRKDIQYGTNSQLILLEALPNT